MSRPWQQDYPILIFDMSAFNNEQKYKTLKQTVAGDKADLDQANQDVATAVQADDTARTAAAAKADDATLAKNATDADNDLKDKQQTGADAKTTYTQDQAELDAASKLASHPYLYWKEANDDNVSPLPRYSFVSKVYLAEKVLILVCNAGWGDGSDINQQSIAVSGPEGEVTSADILEGPKASVSPNTIDRLYILDQKITGNSLTQVNFTISVTINNAKAVDPVASALVERHRLIRFSAGGGLLVTHATPNIFSLATVPTTVTTTTTVSTVTTTPTSTTTTTSNTPVVTSGTAEYIFGATGDSSQMNSIAGLTFYPFGHDTFPVTGRHFLTTTYAFHKPWQSIGIFAGTSVNTLGNFTVARAFEIFPGIQLFAGATWWSKSVLLPNTTACNGYGISPSYVTLPLTTTTSSTTITGATPSTTTTTTTVSGAATSGCSNGDRATILSGSAMPTQNTLQPAWGFGVIFNTNLLSAFKGLAGK